MNPTLEYDPRDGLPINTASHVAQDLDCLSCFGVEGRVGDSAAQRFLLTFPFLDHPLTTPLGDR